ncbi:HlyD family efflux transporter periplasmic adaptor subunit [Taibaiella chishuiensis]|uniref:HlyD family secretion protein n=1 Tax=Taibaiella chishuiensis TaxID=1434707 RepID=A0A2P8DBX0_9BACT|nr:HlyD family efflux transporter periplasmic adaptor subunit [Taibaiella chishuiensis]PSK94702.1 HlyD family secretion protein [Taibaiella chishuiensis]
MPEERNNLENTLHEDVRSEEVQEIMGKMPAWLVRRGITLVAILLLVIGIGAYFFKYPDVIPARVLISSSTPPVKLVARSNLPIQKLFVKSNETVKPEQVLCILTNASNYDDLQKIVTITRSIDTTVSLPQTLERIEIPTGLQMGELQTNYAELYQAVQDYRFYLKHNSYGATLNSLSKQAEYTGALNRELDKRERMLQEQLALQHNRFSADSSLVKERVISRAEYETSRKTMLDQQMNTQTNRSSIIQNNLQQTEYQKNIAEISQQRQSQENTLLQKIRDASSRFSGQYAQWEQTYIIKSPIEGVVTFFKFWKENQFVQAGEGVMMVTPPTQQYIARGELGPDRSGKIEAGQDVLIKLTAYPFEEYGMLRGKVLSRSAVAMDSVFLLEIKLADGLRTNAGKVIPDQPQLDGIGEILTEDKSVLQRLFEKVFGKWRR